MVRFLALHLPNTKNGDKQWKQTRYHDAGRLKNRGNDRIPEPLLGNLGTIGFQAVTGCINPRLLLIELFR